MPPDFFFETGLMEQGYQNVAGVDEAGRGPLAGPVVAAAVILDPSRLGELAGLDDSKKLTPAARERLFQVILRVSLGHGLGQASEAEVDEINVLQAALLAMRRALGALNPAADVALIDGPYGSGGPVPSRPVVKGDGLSLSVAAASVLAKVTRDRIMLDYHRQFPIYGFDRHKGYGTSAHRMALEKWGPCGIHRRTFMKNIHFPAGKGDGHGGRP